MQRENLIDILAWKYPGVQGISTIDDVLTEFPDHLPTPSEEDIDSWEVSYNIYNDALVEINRLEAQVTNRRLREAFSDSTWLDAQEALIAIERAKL